MYKNEIIEKLYKDNVLKNYLHKYYEDEDNLADLEQDIYILLLRLPDDVIGEMYESNKLNHWITATIKNQIHSKTSYYYKTYKEFKDKSKDITDEEF